MKKNIVSIIFFIYLILPSNIFAQLTEPDIDVTNIEISPKYNRYRFINQGVGRVPILVPIPGDPDNNPENDKHWPDPGENITITVHFINKGQSETGNFDYKLLINDIEKEQGTYNSLLPGQKGSIDFIWTWPNDFEDQIVKFIADPDNNIQEISKTNNQLSEYINSLSFSIWIEELFYNLFNQVRNGANTYSFEDWMQWQFDELKRQLVNLKYTQIPNGITERIRIDRFIIVPYNPSNLNNWINEMNNDTFNWQTDGRWQFVSGKNTLTEKQADWNSYLNTFINRLDYGLTHELVHQLGIIDDYRLNKKNIEPNNLIEVTDKNGNLANAPTNFECQGLMGGDSSKRNGICYGLSNSNEKQFSSMVFSNLIIEDHALIPLNLNLHYRRGYYGDYLFDIPDNNFLKILDVNDAPLSSAQISLYQKNRDSEVIDNIPEHDGITDSNGLFFLNNRQVYPVTTATGHTLKNNPFGQISVIGENCTFFIKISYNDNEEFQWLTIRPFNMAYWSGQTNENTILIHTNFETQNLSPTPTSTPTPKLKFANGIICYNSRFLTSQNCYDGNYKYRFRINNNTSNTQNAVLRYYTGNPLTLFYTDNFSVPANSFIDKNLTDREVLCEGVEVRLAPELETINDIWITPNRSILNCSVSPIPTPTPTRTPTPTPTRTPTPTPTPTTDPCPNGNLGNINCSSDGKINEVDLNLLLVSWAPNGPVPTPTLGNRSADLNNDNKVDEKDLNILLVNMTSTSTPTAIPTRRYTPTPPDP